MFEKVKSTKGEEKCKKAPVSVDAFELLKPSETRRKWNVKKTYIRKRKFTEKNTNKVLPFQNADTKGMILQWLSNTQNHFQRLTQSPEIYDFCEDDNNSFRFPSVSQNNAKSENAKSVNKRDPGAELDLDNTLNLRSRKIKRPHTLNLRRVRTPAAKHLKRNLSFNTVSCNYNIEEFESSPLIPANMENPTLQKNIIQQLEDDFLDSIETEVDITKYNAKSNNFDGKHVLGSGLDRIQQMRKSVCKENKKTVTHGCNRILSPKIFVSIGVQTVQVSLKDACSQIEKPLMKNSEMQTSTLKNASKSTQTSDVMNLGKSVQTSQIESANLQLDFGVQVEEGDLRTSPDKDVLDNLVEKYLEPKRSEDNSKLEFRVADLYSSLEDVENIPNRDKESENKTILSDILETCPQDPLNQAILLTESENTLNPKTQLESAGIISQTQPSNNAQKSAPVESIGIITQTQLSRSSPIKLFKAKKNFQITKSIENIELSDGFENLEYNTPDILARDESTIQNKTPNTQISSIEISVDNSKAADKIDFDKNHAKRMKRIRFPDDTDSDDEQPKPKKRAQNKFLRDDLSVEFQTEPAVTWATNSDDVLPEELPDVCHDELVDDFNFEDCIRKIEKNFDPAATKSEIPQKSTKTDKLSTPKTTTTDRIANIEKTPPRRTITNLQLKSTKAEDVTIFKSPVKRAKRSILSEIICPNEGGRSPAKIQVLDNILVQNAANKSFENDRDLDDVICSDESMEENTKLRTFESESLWNTPKKNKASEPRNDSLANTNISFKLPSLMGGTPDFLNLPSQDEEILLAPPPGFGNFDYSDTLPPNECINPVNKKNVSLYAQYPEIDSTVNSFHENTPIDSSTQRPNNDFLQTKQDYDILSLSPIKPAERMVICDDAKEDICPLTIVKRDKPIAKPLNLSNHSTPKIKQNSIMNYIKRTQNRTHLNTSSASMFKETEELVNEQKNSLATVENAGKSSENQLPCVACSRLSKDDVLAVTTLVRKKLITFKRSFDMSVTHLIVSANKSNCVKDHTMKFISAVSAGIWVLNSDWIKACIQCNEIVKEDLFEVLDVSGLPGPMESRLYRDIRPLLAQFRILSAPPFRASEKTVIQDVIRNLGGTVVDDAIQFLNKGDTVDLVITEASSTQSFLLDDDWLNVYHVATVDIEWLSRSIGQYKTLSFLPFLLCDADEVQDLNMYPQELLIDIPGFTFSTQPDSE